MSIHIDTLRDLAANRGLGVCDEVADELEAHERAYALLFAENGELRSERDAMAAKLAKCEDDLKIQRAVNDLAYRPHRLLVEQNDSLHARLAEADRVVRLWAGYDANRNDRMTSAVKTAASREEAQAATLLYLMNNVE
jgi:predicted metalloprotease